MVGSAHPTSFDAQCQLLLLHCQVAPTNPRQTSRSNYQHRITIAEESVSLGDRFLKLAGVSAWGWLAEVAFITWTTFFFPLFLGLLSALLAAVEHRAEGFKHLFALPVGRVTLTAAKHAAALLLVASSYALLALGVVLAGLLLRLLAPDLGFEASPPLALLARLVVFGTAASTFAAAVQTWIALLRREFASPIALAVLATVSLLALRSMEATLVPYHPWSYPAETVRGLIADGLDPAWWLAGAIGGLLFAAAACWSFSRRDVV